MFGFGKSNEHDVRLTDKQIQQITKDMSRSERREFNKLSVRWRRTGNGML